MTVDGERIIGEYHEDTSIAVFRGVPFAEPPVDELRWRAPQPLKTKVVERNATKFAPACMQSMRILTWYRRYERLFGGSGYFPDLEISEDCLYLNVWTPSLDVAATLPVMVYVHGGSNISGWSYEPDYRGHNLVAHDVVVVTITYRGGPFGFVSHPALMDADAIANFGLWDIKASLEWVQANISLFGGDPDRVTVFSESSGAQDILALMFGGALEGLVHNVTLQSTAGYGIERVSSLENEMRRGEELQEAFGFRDDDALTRLRQVPADELLALYTELFPGYYHSPAIDGQILKRSAWQSIVAGYTPDVSLIIGSNGDEWYDYIDPDVTRDDLERTANDLLSIADSQGALAAVADEENIRIAMDRLITGDRYLCTSQYIARMMATAGRDTWMYYFTRIRDSDAGRAVRAYHGAELPYVFGTHPPHMPPDDTDMAITSVMQGFWTNLAKNGDPRSDYLPAWPRFDSPDYMVLKIDNDVVPIPPPEPELCAEFDKWVETLDQVDS